MANNKPSPKLPRSTAALIFWPVAIIGAALDLWSKWAVFRWLPNVEGMCYTIIDGFLGFILRVNEGAAFSMFQGWTLFLISVSVIALIVVIGIFFWKPWSRQKPIPVSSDKPSLAIVHFENISGDESLEGWRTGLTELLITDLMQSKFLNVITSI